MRTQGVQSQCLLVTFADVRRAPIGLHPSHFLEINLLADRGHGDVPLCELAGLARTLGAGGAGAEEIVRGMQTHFGLRRLAASTRERFAAAVELHLDADGHA
jgi:hypothetical protein